MDKNNDIHLKTALDISRIRFTAGIRHLFDTPVHILTSVVLMAMLIGLWLYADGVFTSTAPMSLPTFPASRTPSRPQSSKC